jgi:ferrous iron transport protein B
MPDWDFSKPLKIALAGNPNSGKSTLFNALTGLRQRTGNFPGVTVEKKTGDVFISLKPSAEKVHFKITDLPGTYSLFPKSEDEKIACQVLTDPANEDYPDITIIVVDASALKRSLLLATQIMDLNRPVILALNMIDVAEEMGYSMDEVVLEKELGVPVVKMNSRATQSVVALSSKILQAKKNLFQPSTKYSQLYSEKKEFFHSPSSDSAYASIVNAATTSPVSDDSKKTFFREFETRDNLERFKQINVLWDKAASVSAPRNRKHFSQQLDDVLTHRVIGPIVFMLVLFVLFQSVFFLADFPMAWIELLFSNLSSFLAQQLPQGKWSSIVCEGLLPGLSGVFVFVPQLALLFAFLAILEDTGYMARVSIITDRLMRGIGLNGKSVIPLVSGVACAVPAIMGTRIIPNKKERLITLLVTPLMSCSARLPVFTLLIAVMIPEEKRGGFLNERGLWMLGLYLLGFFAAILVAFVMKLVIRSREKSHFIMELPIYRVPQWKTVFLTVVSKVKVFLWDAGRVILTISLLLWLLKSWGPGDDFALIEKKIEAYQSTIKTMEKNTVSTEQESKIEIQKQLIRDAEAQKLEASYIGKMGHFLEPAIAPLGFDWKIGVSLITSFAAREVFVGSMATIYGSADEDASLRERISQQKNPVTGEKVFSFATCVSLLLFYVFALQCMSTLAVVRRETQSWKWPLIQFVYMGLLAWSASYCAFAFLN